MKKRLTAVFILLTLVLSACTVQPQETSAPTETTAPTQPTEATKPTEPPTQPTEPPTQPTEPPTEPPTQPTEPELSYYEQVQTYTPISGYSTKVCWGKVLNNEVHGSMPSCKLITSGKVDSSQIYSLAQGWCSTTSTNSDCPLSFDELSAQYSDKFFETHFLFVAKIFSDAPPAIDRILVGDPVFFKNTMIVVYNADTPNSGPSNVYYVFIEVPRAYLNDANKYTMMWDREIESLKKGPTEPPTQPTEPELSYKEKLQQYTEITDYKLKFAYHAKLEPFMGQGWNHAVYTEPIEAEKVYEAWKTTPTTWKISLTSTNAACPQSFKEICAQYDAEFFKHSFLLLLTGHGSAEAPPSIEKILVGEPLLFNRSLIAVHDNPSGENEYYSVFVELPLKYLEYVTGDRKAGDLPKWDYENMLKEETEPPYKDDGLVNARQEVTDYSIKMAYCDLIVPEIVGSMYTGQLFESADSLSKFITARCNTPELSTKVKNDICPQTFEEVGAALLAETDFTVSNVGVFYVLGTPDALPDITKVEYVDYTIDSTRDSVKSFMISLTNFGAVVGDLSQVKYYQVFVTVPKNYEIPKTQPEYPFVPTFLNRVSK